jgi:hypothetical protein
MKDVLEILLSNFVQMLTIASTFIATGGLAAIIKFRKEQQSLKNDVEGMKKLICYRKNCPDRLANDEPCERKKTN